MHIIALTILTIGGLIGFFIPVCKRLQVVRNAPGKFDLNHIGARIWRELFQVLFQTKVIKQRPIVGLAHALIFWGFLAFIIVTLNHFIYGFMNFKGNLLGECGLSHTVKSIVAVFAGLVILGITTLFIRRFFIRPEALGKKLSIGSGLVALFIEILMITYLLDYFKVFPEHSTGSIINWWVHSFFILAFLVLIPHSKHLHLVFGPFTLFLKDLELARIKPLDIEKEEIGVEKLSDLDKHSVLGALTCVECGRCYDHCPARGTGKVLDPKQWMLDIRAGLLKDPGMGNPGEVLNFEMIWQCTTCGACTYQCPVGIDQVIPIIGFRRGFVSNGEFPAPMRPLFDNLERSGNPWKYQPQEALDFIEEADIPIYDGQEYLFWMGCMGRYDADYRKVSRAFANLLKKAGVSFGVLPDEKCTGDAARRAGNEFLYIMLAEENIERLNGIKSRKIITTCPHCLRTLNEYKDMELDKSFEIIHHSTFINNLINAGKIDLVVENRENVVYHDACYLSRYLAPKGYREPRLLLNNTGANLIEAKRIRDTSFCCGAGGGMLFTEETEGTRINHERMEELMATGAKTIATSCPFCKLMLKDAINDKGIEGLEVKDLVEFLM